jgi:hypothetical protein
MELMRLDLWTQPACGFADEKEHYLGVTSKKNKKSKKVHNITTCIIMFFLVRISTAV